MTTELPETPELLDADPAPLHRPSALRWLWYCVGGRLPERHRAWVLHDVTCRTWLWRHFARSVLIILPLCTLYLVLMPASLPVRLLTGLTFTGALFLFSLLNSLIDTDRRAVRAGHSVGVPARLRAQQAAERQRLASYQRRERIAQRQQARRG